MKREIKFRAWNQYEKIMLTDIVDGMMIQMNNGQLGWYNTEGNFNECNYLLMQYTGLKDKNGKEIYEGDVVKSTYGDGTGAIGLIEYHTERAAFIMCDGYNELIHERTVEIIGNIYENPELL